MLWCMLKPTATRNLGYIEIPRFRPTVFATFGDDVKDGEGKELQVRNFRVSNSFQLDSFETRNRGIEMTGLDFVCHSIAFTPSVSVRGLVDASPRLYSLLIQKALWAGTIQRRLHHYSDLPVKRTFPSYICRARN